MKRVVTIMLLLATLCGGCSLGGGNELKAKLAEGRDPSKETVDSDCAYLYFLLGRNAELAGKSDDARESYEKALVCDLHSVPIMRRLAALLATMGKKRDAAAWTERIISENPGDMPARSFLANLYLGMEQPDKAEAIYREIVAKDAKDYDDRLYLGLLLARQKKFAEARNILEALVQANPTSGAPYPYLARLYLELGEQEKARATYEKGLEVSWSPLLAFEYAGFLEKGDKIDGALKVYRRILQEDDTSEGLRSKIVALLLKAERIPEAIKELEALRVYASEPTKVELNLSRLLFEQKRYEEALGHLREALGIDAGLNEARILMAVIHHEQGNDAAAVKVLSEIRPGSSLFEDATQMLVRLVAQGQGVAAAEKFIRERLVDPKTRQASFYSSLAELLQERKDLLAAEAVFDEALALYPENSELYLEYAVLQEELGGKAKALAAMKKLLAAKPEDPYALNYIGYTMADRGENLEQALDYVRRALAQKPDDGFVRDSLGWVLFKLGRVAEAAAELEKAREIEPGDSTINEHLGDVYLKLGRTKDALDAWAKALEAPKEEAGKESLRQKINDAKR
ncbi:MAG: tetratricopeptide repeat protein [Desulfobulbaceae bacterium]|nr:tetratricopeptide repeat protein [Desulfobulbaceae bacterium]